MESEPTDQHEDDIPLPTKPGRKPQARGNIGPGKLYPSLAEFDAAIKAHDAEKAVYKVAMADREKRLKQLRDRKRAPRDQSGRHPSGAKNRKKADAAQKDQARDARVREWHKRQEASRSAQQTLAAKARAAGKSPPPHFVTGEQRRAEEMELLGDRYVDNWQRVRVTASSELHGRCGQIIQRAQLCTEDKHHWKVTGRPQVDPSGNVVLSEEQFHWVLLDDENSEDGKDGEDSDDGGFDAERLVRLSPYDVEPWPRAPLMPSCSSRDTNATPGQHVLVHEEHSTLHATVTMFNPVIARYGDRGGT